MVPRMMLSRYRKDKSGRDSKCMVTVRVRYFDEYVDGLGLGKLL